MKILFIDEDSETLKQIQSTFKDYYIVEYATTSEEGEYKAHINEYCLLLISHNLPNINAIEICKKLQTEGIQTPVIILSCSSNIEDKILALNNGADDYLIKPFDSNELRARIEVILRRPITNSKGILLTLGDLIMDLDKRIVFRSGEKICLKRKEMDLLEYLLRNKGKALTRAMILDHVWDSSNDTLSNTVDVHIKFLRDQIDRKFDRKLIQTVHGYGYKIEE